MFRVIRALSNKIYYLINVVIINKIETIIKMFRGEKGRDTLS